MGQSERSNVIKMENCTVFWMKVDGWIRSEAVNINTKAVYFHAVTLRTFNFRPVSKKMTNRQVVKEGRASFIHFFLTDRFIHDSFIHEKPSFCQKSILSTFENFAQNTVLSTFFANETFTRSFRQINHSSL